jgi:YesN/AraC family two-component response regulator
MVPHPGGRIRIMLVDAYRIVLSGLQRLIDDEKPELGVVATATDRTKAAALAATAKPDVVVVDVELATERDANLIP